MKRLHRLFVVGILCSAQSLFHGRATAGVATSVVRGAAESLLEKGSRELAAEGTGSVTRKLATIAEKYGASGVAVAELGGSTAFRYLAEGGEMAPQIVKFYEKFGDHSIHVIARPKSMAIFIQHGEEAAAALIRHPGVAADLINSLGKPAARALASINGQSARRLAMLAQEGILEKTGRAAELMEVIIRYGDRAMEFIWRNKGSLTVATTLAAFLANPEAFINGTVDLTSVVAVPIIGKAGDAATSMLASHGGLFVGTGAIFIGLCYFRRRKTAT